MKLILTGSIALDRIMVYPGKFVDVIQPDKLHLLSISLLLNELKETRGGVASNIAYTMALLGDQPVLYGSVGENARGYMNDLEKMGVDTSLVQYSDKPTATFTVMTDMAHCQIGGFFPGAMADAAALNITRFEDEDVLVVISPHDPQQMAKQVAECKNLGKRLFYDIGQQISNVPAQDIRAGIEAAELLIVNDYEMGVMEQKTGWSLDEIKVKVKTVVITLGKEGCEVIQGSHRAKVPVVHVDKIVDPTGAGDAFRAGFLCGYTRDLSPVVCAQLGVTAAAYAIEKPGTQEHHFTLAQFKQRFTTKFETFPAQL